MASAPKLTVAGPARSAFPYGLLAALTLTSPADVHWQNGVEWETAGCADARGLGDLRDPAESGRIGLPKQFDAGGGVSGDADPFTVYYGLVCSPIDAMNRIQDRATEGLLVREGARVEQAVWTGDLGNVGFASAADDLTSTTPPSKPVTGFVALEEWIGDNYGSLGTIHIPRAAALAMLAAGVVEVSGGRLQTKLGTPVIAGAGYPGTSPDGDDPAEGSTWAYVTPPLFGYRSEVFVALDDSRDLLDTARNDLYAIAERTYVIGWDQCSTPSTAAVNLTLEK